MKVKEIKIQDYTGEAIMPVEKKNLGAKQRAIILHLENCEACPYVKTERTKGAGYAIDYFCTRMDGKPVSVYMEIPSDMKPVPDWCPIALNTTEDTMLALNAKEAQQLAEAVLKMDCHNEHLYTGERSCKLCGAKEDEKREIKHLPTCAIMTAHKMVHDVSLRCDKTKLDDKVIDML
jgi:hypothetical protein